MAGDDRQQRRDSRQAGRDDVGLGRPVGAYPWYPLQVCHQVGGEGAIPDDEVAVLPVTDAFFGQVAALVDEAIARFTAPELAVVTRFLTAIDETIRATRDEPARRATSATSKGASRSGRVCRPAR
jgi:hypothetical protein